MIVDTRRLCMWVAEYEDFKPRQLRPVEGRHDFLHAARRTGMKMPYSASNDA